MGRFHKHIYSFNAFYTYKRDVHIYLYIIMYKYHCIKKVKYTLYLLIMINVVCICTSTIFII